MRTFLLYLTILVLMGACSGGGDRGGSSRETKDETPETAVSKAVTDTQKAPSTVEDHSAHPGKALYAQHCLPCHQSDGNGVPGMFPPLTDRQWIDGDADTLIGIVIHGMDGEIEVNGETYNTVMAGLPYLSDREVADILNYVKKRFGSDGETITVKQVKTVRNDA